VAAGEVKAARLKNKSRRALQIQIQRRPPEGGRYKFKTKYNAAGETPARRKAAALSEELLCHD
jgi:hypothetical protein